MIKDVKELLIVVTGIYHEELSWFGLKHWCMLAKQASRLQAQATISIPCSPSPNTIRFMVGDINSRVWNQMNWIGNL